MKPKDVVALLGTVVTLLGAVLNVSDAAKDLFKNNNQS